MTAGCASRASRGVPSVLVGLVHCGHGADPSHGRSAPLSGSYRHDRAKTVARIGYNWAMPVPVPPSIPSSFTEIGRPGLQLGPLGSRRPARHPQPHRPGGPAAGRGVGAGRRRLPPRPPPLGGRGHPDGVRPGSGQPHPHHGLGQRAPGAAARVDRLLRGRRHHGHAVRHPLGRPGPRLLRRRPRRRPALQRLPGLVRSPRPGPSRSGSTWSAPWCPRGLLLDVARAKGLELLEPGYPITPDDLDAACALGGLTVEPGDVVLVRTGQIAHLALPGRPGMGGARAGARPRRPTPGPPRA